MLRWANVLYGYALTECGVRYCPGRVWCTILPWGNVVYDTALGTLRRTILLPGCNAIYCEVV